jgi:hypothetical protein
MHDAAEEHPVRTLMIFHEVDDVDHWLKSPKRQEIFGPLGITARTLSTPSSPTGSA